jgi:hypothetical protein
MMIKVKSLHAIFVLSVIFLFLALVRLQAPELDHGDEWADATVQFAGRNYVKLGFINTRFLPVFGENEPAYTHYPALPEVFNGVLQHIWPDRLVLFRVVALLFAFLNMLFWFLFARKVSGSALFGLLAGLFYITNPYFIYGMDSLQALSYSDCIRSLILLIFVNVPAAGRSRRGWLAALWGLIFLEALISFEYIVYLAMFFALIGIALKEFRKAITVREWFILGSASVAGFGLHFLQNAWYFGSAGAAFSDLAQRAIYRSLSQSIDGPPNLNLFNWFNIVILRNFSLVFMFDVSLLVVAGYCALLLYKGLNPAGRQRVRPLFKLTALFALCGVSWYVVFSSHSYAHAFVGFLTRHVVPAASLGFAAFFYLVLDYIDVKAPKDIYIRAVGAGLAVYVCLTGVLASGLPVTAAGLKRVEQFNVYKGCLQGLERSSAKDAVVGVNYFRYPFMQYYLNRQMLCIFDRQTLESQPRKPDYFIFFAYDNEPARQMWEALNIYYAPKSQCNSMLFPGIIMELKKN